MEIYTYDKKKGHDVLVGVFDGETLRKKVKAKHFMKMIQGWGIANEVIYRLIPKGLRHVEIDTGKQKYTSHIDLWIGEHVLVRDFGHGLQALLGKKHMESL